MISLSDVPGGSVNESWAPVTIPEILGFVLYVGAAVLLGWAPESVSLLGFGATGLGDPFNIPPWIPALIGFAAANGWLFITLYFAWISHASESETEDAEEQTSESTSEDESHADEDESGSAEREMEAES